MRCDIRREAVAEEQQWARDATMHSGDASQALAQVQAQALALAALRRLESDQPPELQGWHSCAIRPQYATR